MPDKDNITGCEEAALKTVNLIDHSCMPDIMSDAILETLIDLSAESRINIWHAKTGISVETLAALYSMYEQGAGYRRMRLYGEYEAGRKYRRRRK